MPIVRPPTVKSKRWQGTPKAPGVRDLVNLKEQKASPSYIDYGTTQIATQGQDVIKNMWARVIERYSAAGLTFLTDKLIALTGIVSEVKGQIHDRNVAGLWGYSLPQGLTWYADHRKSLTQPCRRPALYRAPTWSWASIDGPISMNYTMAFPEESRKDLAFICGIDVSTADSDETCAISEASIRIKGEIAKCKWKMMAQVNGGISAKLTFISSVDSTLRPRWRDDCDVVLDDVTDALENYETVYLLKLLYTGDDRHPAVVVGLVLSPSINGRFTRVGLFDYQDWKCEEKHSLEREVEIV